MDILQSICNEFSFWFRNVITASPGIYQERPEDKTRLFKNRANIALLEARLSELEYLYPLESLRMSSSNLRYLETLAYLDFLETFFQKCEPQLWAPNGFHWLDVGAKNWAYVEAIYRFIEMHSAKQATNPNVITQERSNSTTSAGYKIHSKQPFQLDGIELDPYRRYRDLHTRLNYAQAYIQPLPNARYFSGDVRKLSGSYHTISHFLPFVVEDPCLAWGLPLRYFQPQNILNHLLTLLEPQGMILILNQGEAEAEIQETLLKGARQHFLHDFWVEWTCVGEMPRHFIQYQYPRIGWICQKNQLKRHP